MLLVEQHRLTLNGSAERSVSWLWCWGWFQLHNEEQCRTCTDQLNVVVIDATCWLSNDHMG